MNKEQKIMVILYYSRGMKKRIASNNSVEKSKF